MKQEDPKTVLFFKNLAHIFYATANADKKIVIEEKRKIVEHVNQFWASPVYDSNSRDIIYDTLKELIKAKLTANDAFKVFEKFYKKNETLYTDKIKEQIIDTAYAIAISFAGKNKSETILLAKIEMLFND